MDRGYTVKREANPKDSANLISLLTFRYIHELIVRGNRNDLQENDISLVSKKFKINQMGDKGEKIWHHQTNSCKNRSVIKFLISIYMKRYLLLGLCQLIVKIINVLIVPYSLGKLINYFKVGQTESSKEEACYYGVIVILINVFSLLFEQQYILYKVEFGMEVSTSLCSLLYRKILRLHTFRISEISTGKIVSIITKDIAMIEESTYMLNDIWIETAQGVIVFYLLFHKVGFPAIYGLGCYIVTMTIQGLIAKLIYKKRYSVNLKSDRRLKLIQDVLTSIKVIKMYTWENFFSDKITYARNQEVRKFGTMTFFKFFSIFLGNFCDKMSFFVMILFYIYLGNSLTAEVVYYSQMCFKKLNPLIHYVMTSCASVTAETLASVHRLEYILNAEEVEESNDFLKSFILPKVEFISVDVSSNKDIILKNINIKLRPGLNILVGPTGCGKSTLLKSILGEYPVTSGQLRIEGTISYVPQNPWIFPSSIKQNILFGEDFNEAKYRNVLEVCALVFDLESFTAGDETIINDCDVNLSKGQQARINIARALYKESDIYLFDDPLAALDNRVRSHIFHGIRQYLTNTMVILATHETSFINEASAVIVMIEGRVSFVGKPKNTQRTLVNTVVNQINADAKTSTVHCDDTSVEDSYKETSKLNETLPSSQKANIYQEDQQTGDGAGWKRYVKYFKYGGRTSWLILILVLYILLEVFSGSSEKFLSKWVEMEENFTFTNNVIENPNSQNRSVNEERIFYIKWYTSLVVLSCVLVTASVTFHFIFSLKISRNLHKAMINQVMGSAMSFFDGNLSGNILNRFSKDLYQVDEFLPFYTAICIMNFTSLFSTAILISSVNAEFTILTLIFVIILFTICNYTLRPLRSLKRIENSTRSPMAGHFNSTLEGLVTIRAYGVQNILAKEFDQHQNLNIASKHLFEMVISCQAFSLSLFSNLFTSLIIVRFLVVEQGESSADVGLALTQSFALSKFFDSGLKQWANLEYLMICFQRASEYTKIQQEHQSGHIEQNWPSQGSIEYENVNLTYKSENNLVLKDLNFFIKPNEKIGVVGRTGAGKSSLIMTLFKFYAIEGKILIDDIDIKTVSTEYLRNSIAIIPQDPVIFPGSIRDNIDPFRRYSDNQIWRSLSAVNLKSLIKTLDDDVQDCDIAHSVGQKQLLCLSRAIVRKTKILILDEATSNMDGNMGDIIHKKIEELFSDCTVITIAHRMNFVLNCDRVMVLDRGQIVEFETPKSLIENEESTFYKMFNNTCDQ